VALVVAYSDDDGRRYMHVATLLLPLLHACSHITSSSSSCIPKTHTYPPPIGHHRCFPAITCELCLSPSLVNFSAAVALLVLRRAQLGEGATAIVREAHRKVSP
jgi:hypothetical protein